MPALASRRQCSTSKQAPCLHHFAMSNSQSCGRAHLLASPGSDDRSAALSMLHPRSRCHTPRISTRRRLTGSEHAALAQLLLHSSSKHLAALTGAERAAPAQLSLLKDVAAEATPLAVCAGAPAAAAALAAPAVMLHDF